VRPEEVRDARVSSPLCEESAELLAVSQARSNMAADEPSDDAQALPPAAALPAMEQDARESASERAAAALHPAAAPASCDEEPPPPQLLPPSPQQRDAHIAELRVALEHAAAQLAAQRSLTDAATMRAAALEAAAASARLDADEVTATAAEQAARAELRTLEADERARKAELEVKRLATIKREKLESAAEEKRAAQEEAEQARVAAAAAEAQAAEAEAQAVRLRGKIEATELHAAEAKTRRHGNVAARKELLMLNLLHRTYGRNKPDTFGGVVFTCEKAVAPFAPLFNTNGLPNGARCRGFCA
jgi:hypothetical protein